MEKLKDWLQEQRNHKFIPITTLAMILDETNTHGNVSLKVAGTFPLTYGLLISVSSCLNKTAISCIRYLSSFKSTGFFFLFLQLIGCAITYFLICLQHD